MEAVIAATKAAEAALLLVEARRSGATLANLPDHLQPSSQEEAHRIQDAVIAHYGSAGGWKIFASNEPEPFLSPVPASLIFDQGLRPPKSALPVVLVELEIALVLGRDLPASAVPYAAATVRPAVASLHPLIELITFSWTDRNQVTRLSQLGDLQNSAGFVLGETRVDWHNFDPGTAGCRLLVDGVERGTGTSGANMDTILSTLALLANHAGQRGMPLQKGQVISTGARLVASTGPSQEIRGEIDGLGSVYVWLN